MSYTAFQRKPPKGRCYSVRELCVLLGSAGTPLRADKLTRTIHSLSRQVPGGDVHCKRTRVRLPDGREFDSYVIDDIGLLLLLQWQENGGRFPALYAALKTQPIEEEE